MICSKCQESVSESELLKHLRNYHAGEKDLQVPCPSCGLVFSTGPMFQKHWYANHHQRAKQKEAVHLQPSTPLSTPGTSAETSSEPSDNVVCEGPLKKFCHETHVPSTSVLSEFEGIGCSDPGESDEALTFLDEPMPPVNISDSVPSLDDLESSESDAGSSSDSDWETENTEESEKIVKSGADVEQNVEVERESVEGATSNVAEGSKKKLPINRKAGLFLLKLKDKCNVPSSSIPDVIKDVESLVKDALSDFSSFIDEKLKVKNISLNDVTNVEQSINTISSMFNNIRTEYRQKEFFKEELGVVVPRRIPLGRQFRRVRRKGHSGMKTVTVTEEMVYVPIPDVVEKLVNHPDYKFFVEDRSLSSNSKYLDNYMKGEQSRSNPVLRDHPDALRFVLYYDDLEVCSPLKSRSGTHKLVAFYMFLDNIPLKFRSNLSSIFLVGLVNANLIKSNKYGMDAALEHIMKDLKKFEGGICLKSGTKVFGTLIAVIGDNLGLHAVGGFKEGFTAHRGCRFCLATLNVIRKMTREVQDLLRDAVSHAAQCAKIQTEKGKNEELSTEYGINRSCCLNLLSSFNVIGGLPPDLMHDLLEGLLPLAIKRLLNHYLYASTRDEGKKFTLDWLNQTIKDFDFGYLEATDKPSELKKEHIMSTDSTTLHQSACQTWLLGTVLPLIIGPLVDSDDKYFNNFLDLLDICRIVFSTEVTEWMIVYLEDLIETYLTDCLSLYGDLIPKQHHLIHYPTQIRLLGSLVNYMCIRCEAKHKVFKKIVYNLSNYKNIPWSLSCRHQVSQAAAWSKSLLKGVLCGPCSLVLVQNASYKSFLDPSVVKVTESSWLELHGIKFVPDKCFLCVGYENELPVFAEIVKIIVSPSIKFICRKVHTLEKNYHLAAYLIQVSSDLCIVRPGDMLLHSPLHAHKVKGDSYIALKHCATGELF